MFTALAQRWRRSLAFRVVATTLLAATVLVGVSLGFLLVRVTNGLVDANTSKSIAEASVGLAAAQQVVLQASEGGPPEPSEGLADGIMNALLTSSEGGAPYEVLLLDAAAPGAATLAERGTNLVQVSSVPLALRSQVQLEGKEVWTYTTIGYVNSPDEPGMVVGSLLPIGTNAAYEVYYLFPYGELQRTLDLVRSTAWIAGALLVGLLGLLMLLIARHSCCRCGRPLAPPNCCGPGTWSSDCRCAARTIWRHWHWRSTTWRPRCRPRSGNWRTCRGCSSGSSPTSPTNCARR